MNQANFKRRTKLYALEVMRVVEDLPRTRTTDVLGKQLIRCATSVGANYRAACRAKSPADFIAKMGIVEEEADETLYWFELLIEHGTLPRSQAIDSLMNEGNELLSMTIASIRTARHNNPKSSAKPAPAMNPQSAIRNPQS
jgi:four helix bundle protein